MKGSYQVAGESRGPHVLRLHCVGMDKSGSHKEIFGIKDLRTQTRDSGVLKNVLLVVTSFGEGRGRNKTKGQQRNKVRTLQKAISELLPDAAFPTLPL